MRAGRWGPVGVVLGLLLAGTGVAGATSDRRAPGRGDGSGGPQSTAADDPWAAWDRLDPEAGVGLGLHWEAGVRAREAVPGELESTLLGGVEPRRGLGGLARWRRWSADAGPPADDLLGAAVVRTPGLRLVVGVGRLASGGASVTRAVGDLRARVLGPVLVGGRAALYPWEPAWAPEVSAAVDAALHPWWGGLTLGPGTGEVRVAVGLRLRPGMVWTAGYGDGGADLGMAWALGGVELRADEVSHPLLGAVRRFRVVGGRRP